MEVPEKLDSIRDELGRIKPGHSLNPNGRPKGKTLKEFARDWYMLKSEDEKRQYIEDLEQKRPGFAWVMAEGNPESKTDVTSGGEKIVFLPPEVIERVDETTPKAE
jgi:hypothetical protein